MNENDIKIVITIVVQGDLTPYDVKRRNLKIKRIEQNASKMNIKNRANISESNFAELEKELAEHKTLEQVLCWAASKSKSEVSPQIVSEVVTQDEFTHDVIIPYKHFFLVIDTT